MTDLQTPDPPLATLGNVRADYVHRRKAITPAPGLSLPSSQLKWYDLAFPESPVPRAVGAMAREFLKAEAARGALDLANDLGFVILHRCSEHFYFLIISTWRNENEVWETVYAKHDVASGFAPFPRPGPHLGTFCVWELGAVWHEQQAWVRFLMSARDEAAKRAYLADSYTGLV